MKKEKPPSGLIPKYLHDDRRALEILEAMDGYVRAGKPIPREWLSELNELRGEDDE